MKHACEVADGCIPRRDAVARLIFSLMLAAAAEATGDYDNSPGGDLFVECPPGEGMNFVSSSFTSIMGQSGDRSWDWDWDCRKVQFAHNLGGFGLWIWGHFIMQLILIIQVFTVHRLILGTECSVNGWKKSMKQKIPFTSNVLQMPSLLESVVCLILV